MFARQPQPAPAESRDPLGAGKLRTVQPAQVRDDPCLPRGAHRAIGDIAGQLRRLIQLERRSAHLTERCPLLEQPHRPLESRAALGAYWAVHNDDLQPSA